MSAPLVLHWWLYLVGSAATVVVLIFAGGAARDWWRLSLWRSWWFGASEIKDELRRKFIVSGQPRPYPKQLIVHLPFLKHYAFLRLERRSTWGANHQPDYVELQRTKMTQYIPVDVDPWASGDQEGTG